MILSILFGVSTLQAEIIHLKTGEKIAGYISSQDPYNITVVTEQSRVKIQKKQVARIAFNTTDEQEEIIRVEGKVSEMRDWQKELDRVLAMRRKEQGLKAKQKEVRTEDEKEFFNDELLEIKKIKQRDAAKKSSIFPGWGQFSKGHDYRGWFIMSGQFLAIAGTYYSLKTYAAASDRYDSGNSLYTLVYMKHNMLLSVWQYNSAVKQRANMQSNLNRADLLLGTILLVYGLSIADAYWTSPTQDVLMGAFNEDVPEETIQLESRRIDPFLTGPMYARAPEIIHMDYTFTF